MVDQDYFLVVVVIKVDEELSVRLYRAEAKCRAYLSVTSNKVSIEEVTDTLQLAPTKSCHQGDERDGRSPLSFHGWYFDPLGDGPGECDRKLKALLDLLAPASSRIRSLANRCSVELRVVYHGYKDGMWGLHWSSEMLQAISDLGVDLDVDLYAAGPDLLS